MKVRKTERNREGGIEGEREGGRAREKSEGEREGDYYIKMSSSLWHFHVYKTLHYTV